MSSKARKLTKSKYKTYGYSIITTKFLFSVTYKALSRPSVLLPSLKFVLCGLHFGRYSAFVVWALLWLNLWPFVFKSAPSVTCDTYIISLKRRNRTIENVAIANALQLEAVRRHAVPVRFNFVARAKFELAQPIRCRGPNFTKPGKNRAIVAELRV